MVNKAERFLAESATTQHFITSARQQDQERKGKNLDFFLHQEIQNPQRLDALKQKDMTLIFEDNESLNEGNKEVEIFNEAQVLSGGNTVELPEFTSEVPLIHSFFQTEKYLELLKLYDYYYAQGVSQNRLNSDFVGAVYEAISENYFSSQFNSGTREILGAQATDRLYLNLFPDVKVMDTNFGKIALEGITVPDTLAIENGKISYVGEFSLQLREAYYAKKHTAFQIQKNTDEVSHLFENSTQIFITPSNISSEIKDSIEQGHEDVLFLPIPFTTNQFNDSIVSSLEEYKGYKSSSR